MKIRTLTTLAIGYVIGTRLRPEHIEQMRRRSESNDGDRSSTSSDDGEPQWPDPTFTL